VKILLVDDESLARQRLCRLLQKLRPGAELLQAENGIEALRQVREQQPEIILLDIRMPELDGVAVAEQLTREESPPAVIFCTAFDEYALDALRNQAVAYLLKPVRERELERALEGAVRINRAQLQAIGFSDSGRQEVVSAGHRGVETLPVDQVRCFLAEDKYVRACSPQGDILIMDSLKELESEFAGCFLRVHRNALVALEHVLRLRRGEGGWIVELDGVAPRPAVSRRHLAEFKAAFKGS
jgi:two-component system response regulator AlgR